MLRDMYGHPGYLYLSPGKAVRQCGVAASLSPVVHIVRQVESVGITAFTRAAGRFHTVLKSKTFIHTLCVDIVQWWWSSNHDVLGSIPTRKVRYKTNFIFFYSRYRFR